MHQEAQSVTIDLAMQVILYTFQLLPPRDNVSGP